MAMTAKELAKNLGLAECVARAETFTPQQLRGLIKIAEDYGKSELASKFKAHLQARSASQRKTERVTPGSMLEALQSVGGVAAPYAWYSLSREGRVILHTWRSPAAGRMDGWHLDGGRWTLDSRGSAADAPWKSLPQYTGLLNALDAQAALFGDVVYAAISTDATKGVGVAKRVPGSNALLKNSDGSPAEFSVSFDLAKRWHRAVLRAGQDCDVDSA